MHISALKQSLAYYGFIKGSSVKKSHFIRCQSSKESPIFIEFKLIIKNPHGDRMQEKKGEFLHYLRTLPPFCLPVCFPISISRKGGWLLLPRVQHPWTALTLATSPQNVQPEMAGRAKPHVFKKSACQVNHKQSLSFRQFQAEFEHCVLGYHSIPSRCK